MDNDSVTAIRNECKVNINNNPYKIVIFLWANNRLGLNNNNNNGDRGLELILIMKIYER